MMKGYGLALLCLSSCGAADLDMPPERRHIDQDMTAYMADFANQASLYETHVNYEDINFARFFDRDEWDLVLSRRGLKDETVGYCEAMTKRYEARFVMWKKSRSVNLRSLAVVRMPGQPCRERLAVYHELGHCVLGKDHFEEQVDIMNAVIPSEKLACALWPRLEQKFFERIP
jgi:hypothetical protein